LQTGVIDKIFKTKGYFFINGDDGNRYFCPEECIPREYRKYLWKGNKIKFEPSYNDARGLRTDVAEPDKIPSLNRAGSLPVKFKDKYIPFTKKDAEKFYGDNPVKLTGEIIEIHGGIKEKSYLLIKTNADRLFYGRITQIVDYMSVRKHIKEGIKVTFSPEYADNQDNYKFDFAKMIVIGSC